MENISLSVVSPNALVDPLTPADHVLHDLDAARLRRAVGALPEVERHVICWRYGLLVEGPLSHRQIANRLNMSRRRVRAIERRALESLRAHVPKSEVAA
jgi:RNA polymerase sigma factor (sigma-70 family)